MSDVDNGIEGLMNLFGCIVCIYQLEMRNSNTHIQRQYYNDLSRSHYSSQTSRKLKSVTLRDNFNDTKTRFLTRIEKACTTLSNQDISKEINLYRKEIERLQRQLLKKDKVILEIKATSALNKELEAELIETYRIIYMYEGKISQYEKQLKRMELALAKQNNELAGKVEELLESYRSENAELMGQVEQGNRTIFELQEKLKKVQNKYFSTAWKLSSTKREITNPLKKKFPNLRNTITITQPPLIYKQKALKLTLQAEPPNDYQIVETRVKTETVEKEPIRFKRFDIRPQQKDILNQSPQNRLNSSSANRLITTATNDQSTKINEQSLRRLSSITERKVYASPITRYELNRRVEEVAGMMQHPHTKPISSEHVRTIYY